MKNLEKFNQFSLNEAVQSKSIDVDQAQEEQGKINDLIKIARDKMAKVDAMTNKKQHEKTLEKSNLTQTIAKLTGQLAALMNKEAQALKGLSQEQSRE